MLIGMSRVAIEVCWSWGVVFEVLGGPEGSEFVSTPEGDAGQSLSSVFPLSIGGRCQSDDQRFFASLRMTRFGRAVAMPEHAGSVGSGHRIFETVLISVTPPASHSRCPVPGILSRVSIPKEVCGPRVQGALETPVCGPKVRDPPLKTYPGIRPESRRRGLGKFPEAVRLP